MFSGAVLAFGQVVVLRAPPVEAYTLPFEMTQTSERFFTLPVESTVVPPRKVWGPESITVPLISDSPDAEKPDSTMETSDSFAGAHLGSDTGTAGLGAAAGTCVVVAGGKAAGADVDAAVFEVVGTAVVVVVALVVAAAAAGLSSFRQMTLARLWLLPRRDTSSRACVGVPTLRDAVRTTMRFSPAPIDRRITVDAHSRKRRYARDSRSGGVTCRRCRGGVLG